MKEFNITTIEEFNYYNSMVVNCKDYPCEFIGFVLNNWFRDDEGTTFIKISDRYYLLTTC